MKYEKIIKWVLVALFIVGVVFSLYGFVVGFETNGNAPVDMLLYCTYAFAAIAVFAVLLGVLVYSAPVAFAMGASQTTSNIFKSWCRMFGGQIFLLLMNAWCLRVFTSMVGAFLSNPLSL